FGILVPLWGLGLAGLWAARHGTFPRRKVASGRRRRRFCVQNSPYTGDFCTQNAGPARRYPAAVEWLLLLLGLAFPAVLALIDCVNRSEDHFAGGAEDRQSWIRWL